MFRGADDGDDDTARERTADAIRPKCLPAGGLDTMATGAYLAALVKADMSVAREELARRLRAADESAWRGLGATFDVPCPGPGTEADLRKDFIDKIIGYVHEVFQACEQHRAAAFANPPVTPRAVGAPAVSLRDEAFHDNIRRETHMLLSMSHASLRLTIRSLRKAQMVPFEFVPMDVLPFPVVRHVHNYLTAQATVRQLVQDSVAGKIAVNNRGVIQRDILARLAAPDVFLAGRVAKGDALAFTEFERLFGVFSVGHLAVFAATSDYLPSASPLVDALDLTCLRLHFGGPGCDPSYDTFADLVAALAAVDAQDLFFEVKPVFASVVGAMERCGRRNEVEWDTILVKALRSRNAHKTVAYIDRKPLDALLASLIVLKDLSYDYARNTSDFGALDMGAPVAVHTPTTSAPAGAPTACWGVNLEDDFVRDCELRVFRVSAERPQRMCKKGLHSAPLSSDYCGDCAEFFDDVYFCELCNTPTTTSLALRCMCRGRFSFSPCDVDGTYAAQRKARTPQNPWTVQASFRTAPSPLDMKHAAERHKRLEDWRPLHLRGEIRHTGAHGCETAGAA